MGWQVGAGDIVVPQDTGILLKGTPQGMAIPGWTVILGRSSGTSLTVSEALSPARIPPILPGLGSGWKGAGDPVPPGMEPLVFPSGSLGMTRRLVNPTLKQLLLMSKNHLLRHHHPLVASRNHRV